MRFSAAYTFADKDRRINADQDDTCSEIGTNGKRLYVSSFKKGGLKTWIPISE
jgi:hypothetical protein